MRRKWRFAPFILLLLVSSAAAAGDFDWVRDFNTRAQADPTGFRERIAARFQVGDAQIAALLGGVPTPADAYIVLRLGEMSRQPADRVLREVQHIEGQGLGRDSQESRHQARFGGVSRAEARPGFVQRQ